jgi:hypothetical protein
MLEAKCSAVNIPPFGAVALGTQRYKHVIVLSSCMNFALAMNNGIKPTGLSETITRGIGIDQLPPAKDELLSTE